MGTHTLPVREHEQDAGSSPDGIYADEELFISADSWAGVRLAPTQWDQSYLDLLAAHVRAAGVAGPRADH
jgi:hypothetical protein